MTQKPFMNNLQTVPKFLLIKHEYFVARHWKTSCFSADKLDTLLTSHHPFLSASSSSLYCISYLDLEGSSCGLAYGTSGLCTGFE